MIVEENRLSQNITSVTIISWVIATHIISVIMLDKNSVVDRNGFTTSLIPGVSQYLMSGSTTSVIATGLLMMLSLPVAKVANDIVSEIQYGTVRKFA